MSVPQLQSCLENRHDLDFLMDYDSDIVVIRCFVHYYDGAIEVTTLEYIKNWRIIGKLQ